MGAVVEVVVELETDEDDEEEVLWSRGSEERRLHCRWETEVVASLDR